MGRIVSARERSAKKPRISRAQKLWRQPHDVTQNVFARQHPLSLLWILVLAGCAGTTRYIRDDSGGENNEDGAATGRSQSPQTPLLTGLPTPDAPLRPIIPLDEIDLTVNAGAGFTGMAIYEQLARLVVGGAGRLSWAIVGAGVQGLVLDPDSGILRGVPVLESGQGPRQIRISVTDSTGALSLLTINLVPRELAVGVNHAAATTSLVIKGPHAHETIQGGAGNDELEGGAGRNVIDGGPGFDFVSYESSPVGVRVDLMQVWLLQYRPSLINKLAAGIAAADGGHATGDVLRNIEGVIGSNHNDYIYGDHQDNVIFGGGGEDRLHGYGGNDQLYGGDWIDFLHGGPGADLLHGGAGIDTAVYEVSEAGVWVDLLAGIGRFGDAEGDVLIGITGLIGSSADDQFFGHNRHNILQGMNGDDQLFGRGGFDRLSGGRGNDLLDGGAGNDVMTGGPGTDRFNIADISTGRSSDVITDYARGEILIIAANQEQVWLRKQGKDTYIFNNAAGRRDADSGDGAYAVLRNYTGPFESSVFQSEGIETVIVTEIDVV